MAEVFIPVPATTRVTGHGNGAIISTDALLQNMVLRKDHNSETYATQRAAIDIKMDASQTIAGKTAGRGIIETATKLYSVNEETVYDGLAGSVEGTISAGTQKVYMAEVGTKVLLIDPENGEGWTWDTVGGAISQVVDGDFPTSIADGLVSMDGYAFILGTDGVIYHSDLNDPTSWNALSVIEAEREPDGGTWIGEQLGHVVVVGPQSIEYFSNAANATGSVLTRRSDLSWKIGSTEGQSFWDAGDNIYFVGTEWGGGSSAYMMSGFQIQPLDDQTLGGFLHSMAVDNQSLYGEGISTDVDSIYILSTYASGNTARESIAFNNGSWFIPRTALNGISFFPVIGSSRATTSTSNPYKQFQNGDIFQMSANNDNPTDVGVGTMANAAIVGEIKFGKSDYSTYFDSMTAAAKRKLMRRIEPVTTQASGSGSSLALSTMDDEATVFNTERTINLGAGRRHLSNLGSFHQRNINTTVNTGGVFITLRGLVANVDLCSV